MSDSQDVSITARCLCKTHVYTTTVAKSSLPLQSGACHCTSCRHVTGALFAHCVDWPGDRTQVLSASLSKYKFSDAITYHFCSTCSTPIFVTKKYQGADETVLVMSGALANDDISDLVEITDHHYVGDTVDGGASVWMQHVTADAKPAPRWSGEREASERLDPSWPKDEQMSKSLAESQPEEIPLRCHCGGVNLVLKRGRDDLSCMEPEKLPFFVEPETFKLLATFDCCDSCTFSFGTAVMNWTFALVQHIDFAAHADASSARDFPSSTPALRDAVLRKSRDPRFGTLEFYASSPDVQRYFCSRCSASVFYAVDERPELLDVAIGLLDSPDGARAEGRLAWNLGTMGWQETQNGGWREQFLEKVKQSSEAWRIETGRPKCWLRVRKENAAAAS